MLWQAGSLDSEQDYLSCLQALQTLKAHAGQVFGEQGGSVLFFFFPLVR